MSSKNGEDSFLKRIPAVPSWRKVLYERQPFEDNYVDPDQFLQELCQNKNVKNYAYFNVVSGTFAITQQISIVVLFCFAFAMVLKGDTGSYSLVWIDTLILVITCVIYVAYQSHLDVLTSMKEPLGNPGTRTSPPPSAPPSRYFYHAWSFGRQVVSLVALLVLLSPILRTLTATYSDDTIVALSIFTMTLHVILTDYDYLNANTEHFEPNVSVNSATFGVTMMASRISSPLESGALICFGTICFSLSPTARYLLKQSSTPAHVGLTCLLIGVAFGCLVQIPILAFFYLVGVLMISFVIPWWFVRLHSSVKTQINGPWDEAKPTNSAAAAEWANAGLLS